MIKALSTSETSVNLNETTWRNIPEESSSYSPSSEPDIPLTIYNLEIRPRPPPTPCLHHCGIQASSCGYGGDPSVCTKGGRFLTIWATVRIPTPLLHGYVTAVVLCLLLQEGLQVRMRHGAPCADPSHGDFTALYKKESKLQCLLCLQRTLNI
jgi:hypothetical protein